MAKNQASKHGRRFVDVPLAGSVGLSLLNCFLAFKSPVLVIYDELRATGGLHFMSTQCSNNSRGDNCRV